MVEGEPRTSFAKLREALPLLMSFSTLVIYILPFHFKRIRVLDRLNTLARVSLLRRRILPAVKAWTVLRLAIPAESVCGINSTINHVVTNILSAYVPVGSLQPVPLSQIVLIAGGIGITPMMAHLRGLYNTRAAGFLKQDRFPDVWMVSRQVFN